MKKLDLVQGSDEWLKARLNHLCASEASAIMGCSKHMSRKELMALKKGWQNNPIEKFLEKLFSGGHEHEAQARDIREMTTFEMIPPVVGSIEIDGMMFLASFDGLSDDNISWEHKDFNKVLFENVNNGVLEPHYFWQLEGQCLVADSDYCYFTCSDGTKEKSVTMKYESVPERREEYLANCRLFLSQLENYELEAKQELILADEKEPEKLPVLDWKLDGSLIVSNSKAFLKEMKEIAAFEMSRVLETDKDFEDKAKLNTKLRKAKITIRDMSESVKNKFTSYAEFSDTVETIKKLLNKMIKDGEEKIKVDSQAKLISILDKATIDIEDYIKKSELSISFSRLKKLLEISEFNDDNYGFKECIGSVRKIEKKAEKVGQKYRDWVVIINKMVATIGPNLVYIRGNAKNHVHLFKDIDELIQNNSEAFESIVTLRIEKHESDLKKQLEVKLEEEREAIRKEEAVKAQKKLDEENKIIKEELVKSQKAFEAKEWLAAIEKEKAEKIQPEKKVDVIVHPARLADINSRLADISSRSLKMQTIMTASTLQADSPEKTVVKSSVSEGAGQNFSNDGPDEYSDQKTAKVCECGGTEPSIDWDSLKDASLVDALKHWKDIFNIDSTRAISALCRILTDHKIRIND